MQQKNRIKIYFVICRCQTALCVAMPCQLLPWRPFKVTLFPSILLAVIWQSADTLEVKMLKFATDMTVMVVLH